MQCTPCLQGTHLAACSERLESCRPLLRMILMSISWSSLQEHMAITLSSHPATTQPHHTYNSHNNTKATRPHQHTTNTTHTGTTPSRRCFKTRPQTVSPRSHAPCATIQLRSQLIYKHPKSATQKGHVCLLGQCQMGPHQRGERVYEGAARFLPHIARYVRSVAVVCKFILHYNACTTLFIV